MMRPGRLFSPPALRCPRCNRAIGLARSGSRTRNRRRRRIADVGWAAFRCEWADCRHPVFVFCAGGICGAFPIADDELATLRADTRDAAEVAAELGILDQGTAA